MEFYRPIHSGAVPDAQELDELLDPGKDAVLSGFFRREDLLRLLDQGTDPATNASPCVGIRLYNGVDRNRGTRRMLAVAVRENGFEHDGLYLWGQPVDGDLSQPAQELSRSEALFQLTADLPTGLTVSNPVREFASYFSRQMIEQLLGSAAVSGLRFHEVRLRHIDRGKLSHSIANRRRRFTHVGIASTLDGAGRLVTTVPPAGPTTALLSDLPCPGYCVNFTDTKVQTVGDEPISSFEFSQLGLAPADDPTTAPNVAGPYLIKWQ